MALAWRGGSRTRNLHETRVLKKLLLNLPPELLPLPELLLPLKLLLPLLEEPLELHHLLHLPIEDDRGVLLGVSVRQVLVGLHPVEGVVERHLALVDRFHFPKLDLRFQVP